MDIQSFISKPRCRCLSIAAGLATLCASALILPLTSSAIQAQGAAQRKSATDLSAPEVMSLRRGVAKMMSRNGAPRGSADFRRSWLYWANMHLHFGDDCAGPISGAGMNGVQTFTASNDDEMATWCTCEHGTDQFLTWHRMYLWYFERVLQDAAGDSSLRLPYWDYETDGRVPPAYRDANYVNDQGQTLPNPLRVNARQPSLNAGTSPLDANVTSTSTAMADPDFLSFSNDLENTPHGAVHCATVTGGCPNGLMGSVPVAALDPVFYAHHTNIDRLYECWLSVNPSQRLPNDAALLDRTFTFVDADGSAPQRRVRDMLTTAPLGYTYAAGGGCPPSTVAQNNPATESAAVTPASEQTLATAGPTRIEATLTTVPMAVSSQGQETLAGPGSRAPGRTYVTIDGLQYDQPPGGLYNVYLKGKAGQKQQIGVINFFALAPSGSTAQTGHRGHARTKGSFRFDATEAVKQLGLGPDVAPSLMFEPTSGLAGSATETAATQPMNAQANVRFESARIVRR
jgi:Common central domain of tyrosinase/Polyphenol oxidase middle domain